VDASNRRTTSGKFEAMSSVAALDDLAWNVCRRDSRFRPGSQYCRISWGCLEFCASGFGFGTASAGLFRCKRESVVVVVSLPLAMRILWKNLRIIGLDVSRSVVAIAYLEHSVLRAGGRAGLRRDEPERFAIQLRPDDRVLLEMNSNTTVIMNVFRAHAGQVIVANPL
jgi:hypothetical protein